jgi:hypothetical protein
MNELTNLDRKSIEKAVQSLEKTCQTKQVQELMGSFYIAAGLRGYLEVVGDSCTLSSKGVAAAVAYGLHLQTEVFA